MLRGMDGLRRFRPESITIGTWHFHDFEYCASPGTTTTTCPLLLGLGLIYPATTKYPSWRIAVSRKAISPASSWDYPPMPQPSRWLYHSWLIVSGWIKIIGRIALGMRLQRLIIFRVCGCRSFHLIIIGFIQRVAWDSHAANILL